MLLVVDAQRESHLLEKPRRSARRYRCHSSAATLAVVRRVHFRPRTGSPAVSWSISVSMWAMTSGVFFPSADARRPRAAPGDLDVALDAPAGGDRRRRCRAGGRSPVAAPPALSASPARRRCRSRAGWRTTRSRRAAPPASDRTSRAWPRAARAVVLVRAVGRAWELAGDRVSRPLPTSLRSGSWVCPTRRRSVPPGVVDERLGGCDQGPAREKWTPAKDHRSCSSKSASASRV